MELVIMLRDMIRSPLRRINCNMASHRIFVVRLRIIKEMLRFTLIFANY